MAEHSVTRRGLLGHSFGAYTALALGSGVTIAAADPFLAFLGEWDRVVSRGDAIPDEEHDAYIEQFEMPFAERAAKGQFPNATTREGAVAALRRAIRYDDMEDIDANLVKAALAYLEAA